MSERAQKILAAGSVGLAAILGEALWLKQYLARSLQPEEHIGGWFLIGATVVFFGGIVARLTGWRHGRRVMIIAVVASLALALLAYATLTRW